LLVSGDDGAEQSFTLAQASNCIERRLMFLLHWKTLWPATGNCGHAETRATIS